MGKIQLLSETVSSRIAAGEVVERPASVVKELLENAIDAHATSISISIAEGGIREIRISDNGEGISHEDMPLTIVKHATSKIFTLEDLEHINSMGFRGEALASIAAVSMLTIKSRIKDSEFGTELYAKGGKVEYIRKAGLADGTTIVVENLFYNTPARLKFLKKPSAEAALISDMIARLILANPHISFRYTIAGKVIYHSPGNGSLEDAIYSVYGFEMRGALIDIDFRFNSLYLKGYICSPGKTYKTQKYGTLLVNGRFVRNEFVQRVILRAYGERLLKGNFPFFVLNLTLPPEDVDVNVHPNKLAVHFRDENELEYVILNALESALRKFQTTPQLKISSEKQNAQDKPVETVPIASVIHPAATPIKKPAPAKISAPVAPQKPALSAEKTILQQKSTAKQPSFSKTPPLSEEERNARIDAILRLSENITAKKKEPFALRETPEFIADTKDSIQTFDLTLQGFEQDAPKQTKAEKEPASMEQLFAAHVEYKVLGAAFDTYIILECKDTLYLIDQHAAHERKLYDALLADIASRPVSQPLLAPMRVGITALEKVLLQENLTILEEMGFAFSAIRETYCDVSAYPQVLGESNIRIALQDMIAALEEGDTSFQVRRDKIAKGACKRAIKAGMKMSEADIRGLIEGIVSSGAIPHCPHGRPIAIALTKTQLEDSFKRRV